MTVCVHKCFCVSYVWICVCVRAFVSEMCTRGVFVGVCVCGCVMCAFECVVCVWCELCVGGCV